MSEADKPAFPIVADPKFISYGTGVTKREYFACHAPFTRDDAVAMLQYFHGEYVPHTPAQLTDALVSMRVQYADALLRALERKPE